MSTLRVVSLLSFTISQFTVVVETFSYVFV